MWYRSQRVSLVFDVAMDFSVKFYYSFKTYINGAQFPSLELLKVRALLINFSCYIPNLPHLENGIALNLHVASQFWHFSSLRSLDITKKSLSKACCVGQKLLYTNRTENSVHICIVLEHALSEKQLKTQSKGKDESSSALKISGLLVKHFKIYR